MEAEPSHPADGERSGRQQQPLSAGAAESPTECRPPQPQQPPSNPRPVHGGHHLHHRKPKRSDLLLRLQHQHKTQAAAWQLSTDTPGPSGGSFSSPSTSSLQSSSTQGHNTQEVQSQPNQEAPEVSPSKRGESKPQKLGKYVCTYCGRPCAKPSVLQKHIRSHTGERPYPCIPCGFSFKTKSNLYKHRKSHAHRIKAGLASSRDELSLSGPAMSAPGEDPKEPTEGESTDSEEEMGQYRKERLGKQKSSSSLALLGQEEGQRSDNSQAVKQRLAMRLSERKRGPMASPDDPPSSSTSLGPSSKGSQESGYFSLSRSTEMSRADSQVSPPTAKTYAEIILGKYGRLGGQQRGPHQQHAHSSSSGMEEKSSMPFSVPKTQVIEHITKLITINEAVVNTSEIDSVKPRRSLLSRKSSLELPKFSSPKDPYMFEPKGESPGPSMAGQSFFPHVQDVDPRVVPESSSSVPLLRSHSMPTSAGQGNHSTTSPWGFCRLSHSFDEQQAVVAEMRVGRQHRLLRRQPAIEVPLGAELSLQEAGPSCAATESGLTRKQQRQQRKGPRLYECKACGVRCKQRESYEAHRGLCTGQPIKELERGEGDGACPDDRPQMMHYKFRALAMAVRKRRKEESLEEDPPSPGPSAVVTCSPATTTAVPNLVQQSEAFSGTPSEAEQQLQDKKGISVIQHTSSFEKQESISMESQESIELRESQSTPQKQPQPKSSPSMPRLVRQHNIQVPEILVTVEPDADMVSVSPTATASSSKEPERVVEEFQWPQRSQSMAQLPAEKLPPKKKRLRLAEAAAQSSGESSFESVLLGPRSPSQESNISHSPSRSASFEDMGGKPAEHSPWCSSSTQGSHMLTVPSGPHQQYQPQREMRRSASEQAPASPQHTDEIVEFRSKSFDYGSLSPQQSASAWRERRKCLLVKHTTLGEPDHEEGAVASRPGSPKPGPSYTSHPSLHPAEASISRLSPEAIGKTVQLFHQPRILPFPMQPTGHDRFPLGQIAQLHPVTTAISDVLSTHIIHRAFLHTHPSPPTTQVHPGQLHMAERLGLPLHPFSALLSLQYPTGAGQAVYLPVSPGLTIQVPTQPPIPSTVVLPAPPPQSLVPLSCHHPLPVIATCLAQLTPVMSLVVPVRLQTNMTTYASALYTTLSQILASARSQEPICCMAMVIMGQLEQDKLQRSYLKIPTPDFKSYLPLSLPLPLEPGSVSGEGYGPLGAGGSKRMLSPAASLELSTEAQRQQKRVKEEEEEEEKVGEEEENRGTGRKLEPGEDEKKEPERAQIGVVTVKVEEEENVRDTQGHREEREMQGKVEPKKEKGKEGQGVSASFVPQSPERAKAPSYPSLHTTTSVSWCYLNYVKPNPSPQREPQTSVYTSWSVSVHNPNLPGLSTKLALSLLRSKQKHSSETYTMATALTPATSKVVPSSSRKPHISEVHATPPSTPVEVKEPPQQPEKEEKKGKREEQGPSTSKQSEPLRVQIFEGGYKSNEGYVYVRGRGRGKYVCGECGIRCKKPSMLRKHVRTHTDVRPFVCKHCNFAFKTKGNLTKHMKSKAHGKKCQSMGTSGSSLDEPETEEAGGIEEHLSGSEDQDEHQFSDVDDSEEDDDEDEESSSHDEPPSSCSPDRRLSAGGHSSSGRRSQQGTSDPSAPEPQPDPSPCPSQEPSPTHILWPSGRASSPESRRALFWDTSPMAFSPISESCSPIRSLSPRLELASPNRHLSPSSKREPSPIRALSPLYPLRPLSPSQYRVLWDRASPLRLGMQHRPRSSPSRLPWDIPSMMASDCRQVASMERIGSPSKGQIGPEPCLSFPPSFHLSPSDSPKAQSQSMDRIFSHLPLHSQQARVPYLMIPIGGIQMVQARPHSHPTTPTSASSPPMEGLLLGQTRREAPWCRTPRT